MQRRKTAIVDPRELESALDDQRDPEPDGWSRWVLPEDRRSLVVKPGLPSLPLIVRPTSPFRLLPKAQARLYTGLPVTVDLELGPAPTLPLLEASSLLLSKTWFGTNLEGELALYCPTQADRSPEAGPIHLAQATIVVENEAAESFLVERICLRARHLSLFEKDQRLWTDEVRITFLGGGQHSRLVFSEEAPESAPGATLVAAAREQAPRGLAAVSFAFARL